jgi:uncharacterized protein (DUF427 family)
MSKSPGHREHPEHKVDEERLHERWQVTAGGQVLADSDDVIRVDEDGAPPRIYFPRANVRMDKLARSPTETKCPFKGTAHYFNVKNVDGKELRDAVWSYEEPFDEHADLKDRLAFWDEKMPELVVTRVDSAATEAASPAT